MKRFFEERNFPNGCGPNYVRLLGNYMSDEKWACVISAQGGGGSFQPQWTYRKKIWNSIGSKVNGLHIQLFCFELTNWLTN